MRNPVTAEEVIQIGDVIRRGVLTEEGTAEHPASRRYELKAKDINKAATTTLLALSKTLGCKIEDLLENS